MSGIFEEEMGENRKNPLEKGNPLQTPPPTRGRADARITARSRDSSGLMALVESGVPEG
jgi:hypothetical protein